MNYNSFYNKPTLNHKELIGDNKASDIGGMTEEDMQELLETDLTPYYSKDEIDDLFSRSFVYREKSGSIVTFDCPSTSQSIPSLTVGIEATQAGSGDPSPTNVRPISGWSAVNVYDGPTTDPQDATVYTTALKDENDQPLTCYGGQLANENGVQTLTDSKAKMTFDGTENWVSWTAVTANDFVGFALGGLTGLKGGRLTVLCNQLKSVDGLLTDNNCYIVNYSLYVCISKAVIGGDTVTDFKTYLASNNLEIVCEIATPTEIPQQSQAISTQNGTNNLWADSGDIEVKCLDRIIPAEE